MGRSKLGRTSSHRRATLRNLVTSLLQHERIETTEVKAKQVNALTDKMITLAKEGDLAAKRRIFSYLLDEDVAKKVIDTIGPRYAARAGGYTRITKLMPRRGDAAPMAVVELVQ